MSEHNLVCKHICITEFIQKIKAYHILISKWVNLFFLPIYVIWYHKDTIQLKYAEHDAVHGMTIVVMHFQLIYKSCILLL